MNNIHEPKPWMNYALVSAGAYNLVWGGIAIAMPQTMLLWLGVEAPNNAAVFWQCIGMMVAVYGFAYLIAARNPFQLWAITFVGLLGKIFGPIGFVVAVANEVLPLTFGWTILFNDLIWWIPFGIILWSGIKDSHAQSSAHEEPEADDPIRELLTNTGRRLDELADVAPQMVVFLRHAGCTFCRQSLADISAVRKQIEANGCGIVFVHLGQEDDDSIDVFKKYGVDDLPRISDPRCRLYRQFGLDLGGFSELFGLRVWLRGFWFGVVNGHGIGAVKGNSFQMPGVYLYHCGIVLDGFRHESASDRPNYIALARQIQVEDNAIAV
ncbi:MAG: redoxin domain-containing protein [Planctomycetales bacterium]|nr:redoxin domain-containing protein [Planctomycetales bacterium]